MDTRKDLNKEKVVIIDDIVLYKKDLLRAISWMDFLSDQDINDKDKKAFENIMKIVNYITRNDD